MCHIYERNHFFVTEKWMNGVSKKINLDSFEGSHIQCLTLFDNIILLPFTTIKNCFTAIVGMQYSY